DLRTRSRLAPHIDMRTELLRPLVHADEAEVPGALAGIEDGVADALPIVTDPDTQRRLAVGHFGFDVVRARMPECVAQRLATDQESFLADDRVQVAARALNAHSESCRVRIRKLLALGRERLPQVGNVARGRAQVFHLVPTLSQQLVGAVE